MNLLMKIFDFFHGYRVNCYRPLNTLNKLAEVKDLRFEKY